MLQDKCATMADTGATHELVGLRKGQKIPTGTPTCKLQLAIGHVEGWASTDVSCILFRKQSCRVFSRFAVQYKLDF